jgi:hypothetical protein
MTNGLSLSLGRDIVLRTCGIVSLVEPRSHLSGGAYRARGFEMPDLPLGSRYIYQLGKRTKVREGICRGTTAPVGDGQPSHRSRVQTTISVVARDRLCHNSAGPNPGKRSKSTLSQTHQYPLQREAAPLRGITPPDGPWMGFEAAPANPVPSPPQDPCNIRSHGRGCSESTLCAMAVGV